MPTTIIKSIGSGGGRDYTTAAAWEADTDNDLVAADQIQVGELYDDADFTLSADLNIGGATVDATRFRILRAVAGQGYNPLNDSGVWFRNAGSNFAITLQEANAQLKGIGIENTYTATVTTWCIRGSGVGNLIERCYGEMALHSVAGGPGKIFDTATTGVIFRNCIAVGSNGGSAGASVGFNSGTNCEFYNCIAWGIKVTGGIGQGFSDYDGVSGYKVKNCIAVESGDEDFKDINAAEPGVEYLCSSDSTAVNSGSLTGVSGAVAFMAPGPTPANFYPGFNSPLADAGVELSSLFTDDIAGAARTTPWDMGVYDVIGPPKSPDRMFSVT